MVTNQYLFSLGVSDFSVLRVRFVLIGLTEIAHAIAVETISFVFLEVVRWLLLRGLGNLSAGIDSDALRKMIPWSLYAVPMVYFVLMTNYWPGSFVVNSPVWICLAVFCSCLA